MNKYACLSICMYGYMYVCMCVYWCYATALAQHIFQNHCKRPHLDMCANRDRICDLRPISWYIGSDIVALDISAPMPNVHIRPYRYIFIHVQRCS
jgi:hypothetical protein